MLWMSAALAAIAFSVSTSVRAETERVGAASEGLRAWYLATGSVDRAVQWMLWGPGPRNPDGSAHFWEPAKPRLYMSYPGGDVVVEMIPESSKLNLNYATGDDLTRLITIISGNPELAQEIAAAILDWRAPALGQGPGRPRSLRWLQRGRSTPTISPSVRLFGPGTRLFRRLKNYFWCVA